MVLASFAEMVSRSDDGSRYGHSGRLSGLLFPHFHARQATLHAAHDSVHRLAGSYLIRTRSEPPKGFNRRRTSFKSPRKPGRMRHAVARARNP